MHKNSDVLEVLQGVDLGSSVAEQDDLLQDARIENAAFADLLNDRVDLVPGTKGSGKSALYRIFVEFLPDYLLEHKKAVIAHGISRPGEAVFQAFNKQFSVLDEEGFVDFWCIYFVSLAHEHFVKGSRYAHHLSACSAEIDSFRRSCANALIPEIKAQKSLRDVLQWALAALKHIRPKLAFRLPDDAGELSLDLFGQLARGRKAPMSRSEDVPALPTYMDRLRDDLEVILTRAGLTLWLMVDRLDEIFPRRSDLERVALRALLRTIRTFTSDRIRMKVFLRDDMLDEVVGGGGGFTALTHITSRQADTLRWSEEEILDMLVKRLFANEKLRDYLDIDTSRLDASHSYRQQCFYRVFPRQVHSGSRESSTIRWIFSHTADGNNVVTPRDVIDLVTKALQHQQNWLHANRSGESAHIVGSGSIRYGLEGLSLKKRTDYLRAEFPHLWQQIEKLEGLKSVYTERSLRRLFGVGWRETTEDMTSIGLMTRSRSGNQWVYRIPFVYLKGLKLTQGRLDG